MKNKLYSVGLFLVVCFSVRGEWFKGDLHNHSTYSDGVNSVHEVISEAKSAGFQFLAISDHDTWMEGEPKHWSDPDYTDDQLTLLYGIEWTTNKGHANIFSYKKFDYDKIWIANREQDAQMAVNEAHVQNAIFSINHPEMMFGLDWDYQIPENIDSIEVWNGVYRLQSRNAWSITKVWDKALMKGKRITGLGGSDAHAMNGVLNRVKNIGTPTTWVDSDDHNGESILKAIKLGRVSISFSSKAPRLELTLDKNNDKIFETRMGDNINTHGEISIKIRMHNFDQEKSFTPADIKELSSAMTEAFENGEIDVVDYLSSDKRRGRSKAVGIFKNGKLFKTWKISGKVSEIIFKDQVKTGEKSYYRAELVGKPSNYYLENLLLYGRTMAITNPIYVNY